MCGIFAYTGQKQDAAKLILEGLKTLEYRGYDSWGIAVRPTSKRALEVEKHIGKIGEAHTGLPSSSLGIGHTRWATHGGVTDANAHPHMNFDHTIAVVHNGIIENYQELRTSLYPRGCKFNSETDSEVLAHLVDSELKSGKTFQQAVFATFKSIVGSNAIVVLNADTGEVMACRNGSPLVVGLGKDESILASDVTALLPYTQDVYFLNDGDAVTLSGKGVQLYDISSESEKKLETEKIEWTVEKAQKAGHPHYMIKEILEQIHTIPKVAQLHDSEMGELASRIKSASSVFVIGCGTAYHCALLSSYFFARNGIRSYAVAANEFPSFAPLLDSNSLCIAISQSGETADTLIASRMVKKAGGYLAAIINARASTLERLADMNLPMGAGPEISVVSTKAFTAQLTAMYLLSETIAKNQLEANKSVLAMEYFLSSWLTPDFLSSVKEIAAQLIYSQDIYVIGKGSNYPAALETALKIKEASYIHAEGFAAGELKHGVISLIEKGTPCIVLADMDTKGDTISSATELKSRGGRIIGIAPFKANVFDILVQTPELGDLTCIANVIVGQLLGYYLSVGRGCDPDKPRNLAKSVTVK